MDTMTRGHKLPPAAWILLLTGLALASWATVWMEWTLTRQVTAMTVAPALMFTSFVALWPFLGGVRVGPEGVRSLRTCDDCGTILKPTPRIPFCIHCGAFPKAIRRGLPRAA